MNSFFTWFGARLQEASTWVGLFGLAGSLGVHITANPTTVASLASLAVGLVSAGLIAATTKNPTPVIAQAITDLPQVATDVSQLVANSAAKTN